MKRKHKRKEGKPQVDTSYRVYYQGQRFTVLRTVTDKWGGRRVAVIEHELGKPPSRIDPHLKCIKHICKVWQFGVHTQKGYHIDRRSVTEAVALGKRLDSLWPMHFAAKELKGRVLYVSRSRKPGKLKWIIRVMAKLLPKSQKWLVDKGLILLGPDGHVSLTQAGYDMFVRSPKPKKPKVPKCPTPQEP